jgi:predicted DNA-binding transcriptional regulator YafY
MGMYHPTGRVLAVLEMLQAHGRMRGDELAARLEVDARTVRRYVTILRDLGIPIDVERGRYGAYRVRAGFKLPPLLLTEGEALAVVCALLSAQRLALEATDTQQALDKINRMLPATAREMARALDDVAEFAFTISNQEAPVVPAHLGTVIQAIRRHQRLAVRYAAWSGEITERMVDPYRAVCRNGRWYLVGWCHLRDALRVLRLDHMQAVTLSHQSFEPQPVDALAEVERAIARTPQRWEFHVRLDLPLNVARERVPATIAYLEATDQGVIMSGFAEDLGWLALFLAGLDCDLTVIDPPELRAALMALAGHARRIAAAPVGG